MIVVVDIDTEEQVAARSNGSWEFFDEEFQKRFETPLIEGVYGFGRSVVIGEGEAIADVEKLFMPGDEGFDDAFWPWVLGDDYALEEAGAEKGGAGSGHHAHSGRPGERGGSSTVAGHVGAVFGMENLGIKWRSRLNSYIGYGMPAKKVGRNVYLKWPEAETWMKAYEAGGKGKKGVAAANAELKRTTSKKVPTPPKPKTKYIGKLESGKDPSGPAELLSRQKGDGWKKRGAQAERTRRAEAIVARLPQSHVENIKEFSFVDGYEYVERRGRGAPNSYGFHRLRKGRSEIVVKSNVEGDVSKDGTRIRSDAFNGDLRGHQGRMTVIHEIGHSVHATLMPRKFLSSATARNKKLASAITGSDAGARRKANREFDSLWRSANRKKSGHGLVRDYMGKDNKEFFACSYANYVNDPRALRRVNRPMYNWMKTNVFQGREYG